VTQFGSRQAAFRQVAVVGATAWGTTLAVHLARNGVPTTLAVRDAAEAASLQAARAHERRLPGVRFPDALGVAQLPAALQDADLVCVAVPSRTLRANAASIAAAIAPGATVLSATKGIDVETGRRMSELLAETLPGHAIAALSGPNLSREIAAGMPGSTVIASHDAPLDALRDAFHSELLRVYTSEDVIGVELGGALKNVIAIAAGMVDAFGYGDNAKAAVMTRGLAEMTRLGVAAGANPLTFQGLAGVGDLVATSYSPLSRNRRLGEMLARGMTLDAALEALGETAEGATTVPAALGLARRLDVDMPITAGLHGILSGAVAPGDAVRALMLREPKHERR
jgi:glycerol-3-phosphate dehydrogenase (NAD(P)+)